MDSEKLKQIEEIYHDALEVSPSERAAFLQRTCRADESLLREVESLLVFEDNSDNFLNAPPESLVAEMFAEKSGRSELVSGEIGHYKIIRLLGKGGMGEVYLAEDTKLDRKVALKILPTEFAAHKVRMNRFVREAKSASALNHPNIITIYEIGEAGGTHFIATEFINGKTLNEYLKTASFSFRSALEIAVQIASALDEAHSAGIIHRDIKPDNVMIRVNGLVKVLDFGIAKTIGDFGTRNADLSEDHETLIQNNPKSEISNPQATDPQSTSPGIIIGTADYMSPEQAKGQNIDARTDIFSFGVVLYEMMAGHLPFTGKTSLEVIGALLKDEPQPLSADVPPEIAGIIDKCLRKDRDRRYQSIKDVLSDLEAVKNEIATVEKSRRTGSVTDEIRPGKQTRRFSATGEVISEKTPLKRWLVAGFGVFLILFSLFVSYRFFAPNKQIRSIAVLPFASESANPDADYLSDGMTEMLIRRLSSIPNLSIKARNTVFTYKGKDTPLRRIGLELKVDAVLLGRLSQRGDDLKLDLELVETTTQNVLWTASYDRKMKDLGSLQREIASDVSNKLQLKLTAREQQQITKSYTTDSEAQQLYLRGRFHWNKRNIRDFERAIEYFRQAVEKDPNYALAYAGLADTYALIPLYGDFRPNEFMPMAKQSALKALELDENLSEAHASLGRILNSYDYDWLGAEREFNRSISLNANYPTVHQWYAEFLAFSGRTDEALREISQALELDPLSLVINRMKGNVLGFAGRYDEALVQLNKTADLYPENALVRYNLGDIFTLKGMHKEAVEQYLLAFQKEGRSAAAVQKFNDAFQKNGLPGFWSEHLKTLLEAEKTALEKDKKAYFKNESLAFAYAATKNKDKALEYLNKAFDERDPDLITLRMSPVYDFLAADPRFKELIKKIGLPEQH